MEEMSPVAMITATLTGRRLAKPVVLNSCTLPTELLGSAFGYVGVFCRQPSVVSHDITETFVFHNTCLVTF